MKLCRDAIFNFFFFGHTVLVSRWPPNKVSLFWKYKDQSCAYKTAARISHYTTHIIHSKNQKRASSLLIVLLKHNILIIKEPAPPFYLQTTHTNQCSVADGAIKHDMNFILNTTKITKKTKKHTNAALLEHLYICLAQTPAVVHGRGGASLQSKCELLWGIFFDFNTVSELSLQTLTSPLFFWILVVFSLASQWETP